ncbi:MAG: DnaJ domain-containing protein, partial [Deinococcus-Thermus bacterium]|nr:DnaJ domain-containing protein [Deinococcota bacterium]
MSPIERVRAREEAFRALGVSSSAAPGEIRAAWHRAAFEMHPDRPDGNYARFVEAKAAYELLHRDGETAEGPPPGPRAARRPRLTTREDPLSPEVRAACRDALSGAP